MWDGKEAGTMDLSHSFVKSTEMGQDHEDLQCGQKFLGRDHCARLTVHKIGSLTSHFWRELRKFQIQLRVQSQEK